MNERRPRTRSPVRPVTSLAISLVAVLVEVAGPAAAGSARSTFSVTATVVSNCRRDAQGAVCTRGEPAPKIQVTDGTGRGATNETTRAISPLHGPARSWPSPADEPHTIMVTVNY